MGAEDRLSTVSCPLDRQVFVDLQSRIRDCAQGERERMTILPESDLIMTDHDKAQVHTQSYPTYASPEPTSTAQYAILLKAVCSGTHDSPNPVPLQNLCFSWYWYVGKKWLVRLTLVHHVIRRF